MDTKSLSSLPTELLLTILTTTNSFLTITRLSRVCRALHEIWSTNSYRIADTVLRSTTRCYADALALAEAQAYVARHPPPHAGPTEPDPASVHLTDIQCRVYRNAAVADAACAVFLEHAVGEDMSRGFSRGAGDPRNALPLSPIRPHRNPPFLTASEKVRLVHAFYRVWTYKTYEHAAGGAGRRAQRRMLDSLTDLDAGGVERRAAGLEEHWRLCDMTYFMMVDCGEELRRQICGGFNSSEPSNTWNRSLRDIFESYRHFLLALGHSGIIPRHQGCPKDFYMAVFDDHQLALRKMARDIVEGRRWD